MVGHHAECWNIRLVKKTYLILWAALTVVATNAMAQTDQGAGREVRVPADDGFVTSWEKIDFQHELLSAALSAHVDSDGFVEYDGIRSDRNFQEYLYRLANTPADKLPTDDSRLAYWINAYNAFAIQGVLETLPRSRNKWTSYRVIDVKVSGVRESGKGFFAGLKYRAGGQWFTLDEIEKAILLKRVDGFKKNRKKYRSIGVKTPDPRIHFALVCAAKGCVKLRQEAFEADRVDQQLDEAVRSFVEDQSRIRFHRQDRTINTNELLKWYKSDLINSGYTPHASSVVKFLANFVKDPSLAKSLARDRWNMSYFAYDWTLNLQH